VADGIPDRLLSPDSKSAWYAFPPGGYVPVEDDAWEPPPEGSTIRLMGDYGAAVPLWYDGLLFDEREELESHFGLSVGLATDVVAWAVAWQHSHHGAELDQQATHLVARLSHELGHRCTFVYHR
jgi:hypothetical protein